MHRPLTHPILCSWLHLPAFPFKLKELNILQQFFSTLMLKVIVSRVFKSATLCIAAYFKTLIQKAGYTSTSLRSVQQCSSRKGRSAGGQVKQHFWVVCQVNRHRRAQVQARIFLLKQASHIFLSNLDLILVILSGCLSLYFLFLPLSEAILPNLRTAVWGMPVFGSTDENIPLQTWLLAEVNYP